MPVLPPRLISGDDFRGGVIAAVNQIIQYLRDTRLVADNVTTYLQYTAGGVVIRAIPQPATPKPTGQNGGGGLKFYVTVTAPNGGAGTGTVAAIALAADGTWTATTETATKVFPELG